MFKLERDLLPPEIYGLDPSYPDISTQLRSPFTLISAKFMEVKGINDSA